jgi:hypothetical protein
MDHSVVNVRYKVDDVEALAALPSRVSLPVFVNFRR